MLNIPKLSLADYTFGSIGFIQALQLIKILGFDGVDLGLNEIEDNLHLKTLDELSCPTDSGFKIKEIVNAVGLNVTDIFMQLGGFEATALNSPDPSVREMNADSFKKTVDYALACGSNHMTIVPGCVFDNDFEASLKTASKELAWRVDYAGTRGIKLGIEAHVGSIVDTPSKTLALLSITNDLSLTLDHSHYIKLGATQTEIDQLLPYTSHMHLRNAAKGYLQTVFDESEIDYTVLVKRLKDLNYSGVITIEFCSIEWEDLNKVDTIGETMKLKRHLIDLWNE